MKPETIKLYTVRWKSVVSNDEAAIVNLDYIKASRFFQLLERDKTDFTITVLNSEGWYHKSQIQEKKQTDLPAEIPLSEITPGYYWVQAANKFSEPSIVKVVSVKVNASGDCVLQIFQPGGISGFDIDCVYKWLRRIEYP